MPLLDEYVAVDRTKDVSVTDDVVIVAFFHVQVDCLLLVLVVVRKLEEPFVVAAVGIFLAAAVLAFAAVVELWTVLAVDVAVAVGVGYDSVAIHIAPAGAAAVVLVVARVVEPDAVVITVAIAVAVSTIVLLLQYSLMVVDFVQM